MLKKIHNLYRKNGETISNKLENKHIKSGENDASQQEE